MVKILATINLVQDHKWPKLSPVAQEISSGGMSQVKSEKVTSPQARCGSLGGLLICVTISIGENLIKLLKPVY